jgi:TonB family protein
LLTQIPTERREGRFAYLSQGISVAAHVVLLSLLLLAGRHAWNVRPVTTRGGHATLLYWQDGMGNGAVKLHLSGKLVIAPAKKSAETTPLHRAKQTALSQTQAKKPGIVQAEQAGSVTTKSQTTTGSGNGLQDATPAFPTFSPNPPVRDRSLLPNDETNVVVDVNVSAQGDVLDEKLVRGLGNSIDQVILETVRSWKFHPATLDGAPVSSVSELVFPMSQRYHG